MAVLVIVAVGEAVAGEQHALARLEAPPGGAHVTHHRLDGAEAAAAKVDLVALFHGAHAVFVLREGEVIVADVAAEDRFRIARQHAAEPAAMWRLVDPARRDQTDRRLVDHDRPAEIADRDRLLAADGGDLEPLQRVLPGVRAGAEVEPECSVGIAGEAFLDVEVLAEGWSGRKVSNPHPSLGRLCSAVELTRDAPDMRANGCSAQAVRRISVNNCKSYGQNAPLTNPFQLMTNSVFARDARSPPIKVNGVHSPAFVPNTRHYPFRTCKHLPLCSRMATRICNGRSSAGCARTAGGGTTWWRSHRSAARVVQARPRRKGRPPASDAAGI